MSRFTILHTNDIHGHIEGLARVAMIVEQIRQVSPTPVLYFDGGDAEERARPISRYTKGTAMQRLLDAAGCDLGAVGNGGFLSYGPEVLARYAEATRHPLLLANVRMADGEVIEGVEPWVFLEVAGKRLGVIGLTDPFDGYEYYFGLKNLDTVSLVQTLAAELRTRGADAVIVLSHLGLEQDRALATELDGEIPLIIGAHSHNLLPQGEQVGRTQIAQAGEFAKYLGRIELEWIEDGLKVNEIEVFPVGEEVTQSLTVLRELEMLQGEVDSYLGETIAHLPAAFGYASDRECASANLMADMLRERLDAEVGLITAGMAFAGALPAGHLTRGGLLEVCYAPVNPTGALLHGWQLEALIRQGLNPEFAAETPKALRGVARGLLHLSGARIADGEIWIADALLEPTRTYRVAGSDWEIGPDGGYSKKEWDLQLDFDASTLLVEALEMYLKQNPVVVPEIGRLGGSSG